MPCAGDDVGVVEAGDVGEAAVPSSRRRACVLGVVVGLAVEDDVGAEGAAVGHFHQRGPLGHDDGDGDAQFLAVVGECQGVVAGGGGDDAAGPACASRRARSLSLLRAPRSLKRAGDLEVVELAVDLGIRRAG